MNSLFFLLALLFAIAQAAPIQKPSSDPSLTVADIRASVDAANYEAVKEEAIAGKTAPLKNPRKQGRRIAFALPDSTHFTVADIGTAASMEAANYEMRYRWRMSENYFNNFISINRSISF
jgi:hypothetical protein